MIWTKYCGTAAKAGGNRENKYCPVVTEVSCLLENSLFSLDGILHWFSAAVDITCASPQTLVRPCPAKKIYIYELDTELGHKKITNGHYL